MNKYELKEKLITIGLCEDNEWLDRYVELIIENQSTEKIKYETQRHHIIPTSYYSRNNLPKNDAKENVVNLFTADHCRAHVYLALCCVDGRDRSSNYYAVEFVLKSPVNKFSYKTKEEIEKVIEFIDSIDFRSICEKNRDGMPENKFKWCHNDEEEIYYIIEDGIPDGYLEGRLPGTLSEVNNDTIWLNNGVNQVHPKIENAQKYIDMGYTPGMLDRGDEWRQHLREKEVTEEACKNISKGKKKFFKEHPDFRNGGNWKPGQKAFNENMFWVTNIDENHYSTEEDFPEWEAKGFWRGNTQFKQSHLKYLSFTTPEEVFEYYRDHNEQETADYFGVTLAAICGYMKHFELRKRKLALLEEHD